MPLWHLQEQIPQLTLEGCNMYTTNDVDRYFMVDGIVDTLQKISNPNAAIEFLMHDHNFKQFYTQEIIPNHGDYGLKSLIGWMEEDDLRYQYSSEGLFDMFSTRGVVDARLSQLESNPERFEKALTRFKTALPPYDVTKKAIDGMYAIIDAIKQCMSNPSVPYERIVEDLNKHGFRISPSGKPKRQYLDQNFVQVLNDEGACWCLIAACCSTTAVSIMSATAGTVLIPITLTTLCVFAALEWTEIVERFIRLFVGKSMKAKGYTVENLKYIYTSFIKVLDALHRVVKGKELPRDSADYSKKIKLFKAFNRIMKSIIFNFVKNF